MRGVTHMVGGTTVALAYTMTTQAELAPPLLLAAAGAGLIGGLFPDIDHRGSKISRKIPIIPTIIQVIFTHRGIFHSPAFYLILLGIWMWGAPAIWQFWGQLFIIGAFSHLALDIMNAKGIPVLWPFSKKKISLGKVKLGGVWEWLIRVGLSLLTSALFLYQLFH